MEKAHCGIMKMVVYTWSIWREKKILEYHPTTEETISYQLPEFVTSLIKYSKEELIVLMKDGFYLLHLQNGTLHPIVKPEGLNDRLLLNDAT